MVVVLCGFCFFVCMFCFVLIYPFHSTLCRMSFAPGK